MQNGDCGERRFYDDRRDLVTNPSLIVEVLSDSTEAYDRGDKLRHYRDLRSLRAYLLLSQYRMQAELFLRQPDGTWRLSSYQDPSESIPLRVIEAELSLAEVYDQVELSRQVPSRGWHPMECHPRAFHHWGRVDAATGRQRVLGRVTSRPHGTPA
ncbi:MAG: Uma2 family endonuclease, partial [Bdellovibrio bacteriovorus]